MKIKDLKKIKEIIDRLLDGIIKNKTVIETIAGMITILLAITGFFLWSYGLLNHVTIKEKMICYYGCTVAGISDICAQFDASSPEHMPEFVFDINNNNTLPIFFDNESVEVSVLEYIPYDQLQIEDEWGGAVKWIQPIEWDAYIDTTPRPYVAVASTDSNDDTNDLSDAVLKVDGNDYTKFKVRITPLEAGYYKVKIGVKYKFKGDYKYFQSDVHHLVCMSGFNDYKKRGADDFNLDTFVSNQPNNQNETLVDPSQDNIIWLPSSIKTYSSNGCLIEDYEWEYDSEGNLKTYKENRFYRLIPNKEKKIDCSNGSIQSIEYYEDSVLKLHETFTYDNQSEYEGYPIHSLALAPGNSDEGEFSSMFHYNDKTIRKTTQKGVWGPVITDEEYCFSVDNHLICKKNLDPEANDLYRVVDYYYDEYGNRFFNDNDCHYKYYDNGQISEINSPKDEDGIYTNRFFKYWGNGRIKTQIILSSTNNRIIDYTYVQFPENETTRRILLLMQLLDLDKRLTF